MMKSTVLIKRLKKDGFMLRNTRGSHYQFKHEDGRLVTIPHPRKDIPKGTLRNIYRAAGWEWP